MVDRLLDKGAVPFRPHVILKLRPQVAWGAGLAFRLNYDFAEKRVEVPVTEEFAALSRDLADRFDGIVIDPIVWRFGEKSIAALAELRDSERRALAESIVTSQLLFARVTSPAGQDPGGIAAWLSQRPEVEVAYLEGGPQRPPAALPSQDPCEVYQTYLETSQSGGLGIRAAWAKPGGEGQGIGFVDLEKGWIFDHQDLVGWNIKQPLYGLNLAQQGHGTSVLGIVAAQRNNIGIVGLAPRLRLVAVASPYSDDGSYCCKELVISDVAEKNLQSGDVLLIEIQTSFGNQSDLPLEVEPAILAVLQKATSFLGITVIEAAGNGQVLLDTWEPTPGGGQPLNRNGTTFLDSGAILVGAVDSDTPHAGKPYSNYGNRIDCVAWGDSVWTSGYKDSGSSSSAGHTADYWYFSGTSSAAALVAGMAAQVQGMQLAKARAPFLAAQLRTILSCPNNGTACPTDLTSFFGLMPDMEKLIKNLGY